MLTGITVFHIIYQNHTQFIIILQLQGFQLTEALSSSFLKLGPWASKLYNLVQCFPNSVPWTICRCGAVFFTSYL